MSRNFIPAVLAIGMGIATGYYTFQPALRELNTEKEKDQPGQSAESEPSQFQFQQPPEQRDTLTSINENSDKK